MHQWFICIHAWVNMHNNLQVFKTGHGIINFTLVYNFFYEKQETIQN